MEYPFFVFGQGWSSCCPDRTTQLFELSCAKLCVGDVCVSLTLRSLRNGSLVGSLVGSLADPPAFGTKLKSSHLLDSCNNVDAAVRNCLRPNAAGSDSGLLMTASSGGGSTPSGPGGHESAKTDTDRHAGRKRRWSAPERDQTEWGEREPPSARPTVAIIPQEVKISIEGRSSAGGERHALRH